MILDFILDIVSWTILEYNCIIVPIINAIMIAVSPTQSHESLKGENFSELKSGSKGDVTAEEWQSHEMTV